MKYLLYLKDIKIKLDFEVLYVPRKLRNSIVKIFKWEKRSEIYSNLDRNCCNNTELWKGPFTSLIYLIAYFKDIYDIYVHLDIINIASL